MELVIEAVSRATADEARHCILSGLEEHWGRLDLTLNPDLHDVLHTYGDVASPDTAIPRSDGKVMLVALLDGQVVATGALIREYTQAATTPRCDEWREAPVGRIVRMSVRKNYRRRGIASLVLEALVQHARELGIKKLVLETTETWSDAIGFYQRQGFALTHHADGDAHFARLIE